MDVNQWKLLVYNYWSTRKQMERSENNHANALSKNIKSACGAKSTARIIYELVSLIDIYDIYLKSDWLV
ncbi:Biosynthetic peptidoglycan transglycosylase [Bienertia sinuspersici]